MDLLPNRKKRPQLSNDVANKLLANVFDACETEPNTVPLEKLASYSEYRRERYSLQKVILIIILIIFCLLPMCFVSPGFTIEKISEEDADYPTYEIKVSESIVPVALVSATLDGRSIPVYETGSRTYNVTPTDNGLMKVYVRLINRQYNYSDELDCGDVTVEGIDVTPPKLDPERHYERSEDHTLLYLYLVEEGSGLDYENSYGETLYGDVIYYPIEAESDPSQNLMVFEFPDESANFYIYDYKGNILQLVLSK